MKPAIPRLVTDSLRFVNFWRQVDPGQLPAGYRRSSDPVGRKARAVYFRRMFMRVRTLAALLGLVLLAAPAAAQEQRASLEGTVKDNTGAVLPGVTVDAKNLVQGGVAS